MTLFEPAVDFGVRIPRKTPQAPRPLTPDDAFERFGVAETIKMNFIPQMLTALAIEQTERFLKHCAASRITEFKKHSRLLRACLKVYEEHLKQCYRQSYPLYLRYVKRFFEYTRNDYLKMWFSIGNVVCRQIPRSVDRDAATHIAIIHNLIDFSESYEQRIDRIVNEKFATPVYRKQDAVLTIIAALCIEFEESYQYKLKEDIIITNNVNLFANRARQLASQIIDEELDVNKR